MSNWALILGASSGIGASCARELAKNGVNIYGVYLRKKTNVIYDDVPKLADEDSKEANGNEKIKKNIKTKKIIDKKLVKKKPTKKIINNQDEEINKVETLIK